MAIEITPVSTFSPAFSPLTPSILDAVQPQIEPAGRNAASAAHLGTFATRRTDPPTVENSSGDALRPSLHSGHHPGSTQLDLFRQASAVSIDNAAPSGSRSGSSARSATQAIQGGLSEYATVQANKRRSMTERSVSITV